MTELGTYKWGIIVGIGTVIVGNAINGNSPFVRHRIPQIKQVQQGFVASSKIEIICEDLDHDAQKQPETYLKIDSQKYKGFSQLYAVTRDSTGNVVLKKYEPKEEEK